MTLFLIEKPYVWISIGEIVQQVPGFACLLVWTNSFKKFANLFSKFQCFIFTSSPLFHCRILTTGSITEVLLLIFNAFGYPPFIAIGCIQLGSDMLTFNVTFLPWDSNNLMHSVLPQSGTPCHQFFNRLFFNKLTHRDVYHRSNQIFAQIQFVMSADSCN